MNLVRAIFGGVKEINPNKYNQQYCDKIHMLIDIRSAKEYAGGHMDGAQNIPLNKLAKKIDKLPKDQPVVIVSRNGSRGREAVDMLQAHGYDAANLVGGIMEWRKFGGSLLSN